MPTSLESSRVYRFQFDPDLLAMLRHKCGGIRFDFSKYRSLGVAERRAFLLLSKIYHRRKTSPKWSVRHFCVNILGYSDSLSTTDLKKKLRRVLSNLLSAEVLALPTSCKRLEELFTKHKKGDWSFRLTRGNYYNSESPKDVPSRSWRDTPLYDPLKAIGFEDRDIRWFIGNYSKTLLSTWSDVTLAAIEGKSKEFPGFKKDPQAFFRHHLKAHASRKISSTPDWYQSLIKREENEQRKLDDNSYTKHIESFRSAYESAKNKVLKATIEADQVGFSKRVGMSLALHQARGDRLTERLRLAAHEDAKGYYRKQLDFPEIGTWIVENS